MNKIFAKLKHQFPHNQFHFLIGNKLWIGFLLIFWGLIQCSPTILHVKYEASGLKLTSDSLLKGSRIAIGSIERKDSKQDVDIIDGYVLDQPLTQFTKSAITQELKDRGVNETNAKLELSIQIEKIRYISNSTSESASGGSGELPANRMGIYYDPALAKLDRSGRDSALDGSRTNTDRAAGTQGIEVVGLSGGIEYSGNQAAGNRNAREDNRIEVVFNIRLTVRENKQLFMQGTFLGNAKIDSNNNIGKAFSQAMGNCFLIFLDHPAFKTLKPEQMALFK